MSFSRHCPKGSQTTKGPASSVRLNSFNLTNINCFLPSLKKNKLQHCFLNCHFYHLLILSATSSLVGSISRCLILSLFQPSQFFNRSMSRLSMTQYLFGCLFLFSVFQSLDVSRCSVGLQLRSRRAATSAAPEQGPSNFALKIQI